MSAAPAARPEIVAPAGNPKKLKTAFHFGADAVYLGLEQFSLRAQAGNFDFDELEWALGYAHERGRKVYVALNIQPFDDDFSGLEATLEKLERLRPDAVIVADPGVFALARATAPSVRLHLSTQASVTNARAARFWGAQGMERIVVARELSLAQLGTLISSAGVEIEAFAHGAVCIAYSGRCLLSLYWADRDSRRGECAQSCRWRYKEIEDRMRPGEENPVEQDERGTYFFDAKDLCTMPVLDVLVDTGVKALKIEGRTRSAHYLGTTVDVYRTALEQLAAGDREGFRSAKDGYVAELLRPAKRPFSTHFLTGDQDRIESYHPSGRLPRDRADSVGEVVRKDTDRVLVELVNPLARGTEVELRDVGLRLERATVAELAAEDGTPLERAKAGTRVWIPARFEGGEGAILRPAALDGASLDPSEVPDASCEACDGCSG